MITDLTKMQLLTLQHNRINMWNKKDLRKSRSKVCSDNNCKSSTDLIPAQRCGYKKHSIIA
jgi:hypothetical protein